jgi:oligopeptide/dipeptide ABC transporter ATP-binding protein
METKKELLRVEHLSVSVPHLGQYYPAVQDLSFSLAVGDSVGLIGESGSGKSLTAQAIAGLLPEQVQRSQGHIYFDGVDLTQISEEALRSYRGFDITMVFQDSATSLNPLLTIGYQLREVVKLHCRDIQDPKAQEQRILESLEEVDLDNPKEVMKKYPHQMSGGQRQRVMLAMVMLPKPRLLLADEPTTALDLTTQQQILNVIRNLQQKHHLTLLMISHNIQVVHSLCERTMVLYAGEIVESGPTDLVLQKPLHPYTLALLESKPSFHRKGQPLEIVEGIVPPLEQRSIPCNFAPRCPFHTPQCDLAVQKHEQGDHWVLCNYPRS